MSLGVLNNLSAIHAESNLNNSNNSLNTVLQQLSSGSKINSGADDAAGLSLVDGLQANSMALTQSETNATEGVGLLTVADGALSQVTNLLNRAVTLATEASNGTLNSTQDLAANQEYQSILSEVNNIGTTTTYNQQQVFNSQTSIYTGDSSAQGSSVDALNIRTLSSANLGDTAGVMSYSNGQSNVFINLSSSGVNAAVTDSLNSSGSTTINVSYLTKGANGAAVTANANISVGSGTSYNNTAQGLISAINNAGLGLNATFSTAAQAGSAAVSAAEAAGHGVGGATDTGIQISASGIGANGAGTNGVGVVGALSLASGDTLGGTLSIVGSDGASHNITLGTANSTDTLQNLESTINAAGWGVTASVTGTQMTFTSANSQVSVTGTNLTENTAPSVPQNIVVENSGLGSLTVGNAADTLTGTLSLTEGADGNNAVSTLLLGTQGSTDSLANLANTITNGGYGITASLNQAGTTLTFTKSTGDAGTAAVSGSNIQDVAAPSVATGSTLGSLTVASANDTLGTSTLTINSGTTGVQSTLTLGSVADGTDTLANLAQTINSGNYGITATLDKTGTDLTFAQTSGSKTAAVSGDAIDTTYTQKPITIAADTTLGSITVAGASDTISVGTATDGIVLTGDTNTHTIDIGTAAQTLTQVMTSVNADTASDGIIATLNATAVNGHAAGTILTFTEATASTGPPTVAITGGQTLTDNVAAQDNTTSVAAQTGTLGTLSVLSSGNLVSGTLDVTEGVDKLGTADNKVASNLTLAQIAANLNDTAGNTANWSDAGITATLNAAGTELTFTQASGDKGTAAISSTAALSETPVIFSNATLGSLSATNASDTLSGAFTIQSGASSGSTPTTLNFSGQTLAQIESKINNGGFGITATLNQAGNGVAAGTILTFTQTDGDAGTASITNQGVVLDTAGAVTNTPLNVTSPNGNLGTLTATTSNDMLTGTLTLTEGMDTSGTQTTFNFTGQTIAQIADSFNAPLGANSGLGITATISGAGNNVLTFTKTGSDAGNPAVSGAGITDVTPATTTNQTVAAGTILNTLTVDKSTDTLSGDFEYHSGNVAGSGLNVQAITAGQTLAQLAADFNTSTGTQNFSTYGITASINTTSVDGHAAGTVLTLSQTEGDPDTANVVADSATPIVDQTAPAATPTITIAAGGSLANTLTVAATTDTLTGTLDITEGADGRNTASNYNLNGQTLAEVMAAFNTGAESNLGITATLNANADDGNAAGTVLTFTQTSGDLGTASVADATKIVDQTANATNTVNVASGTMLDTLSVNKGTDQLGGTLNLTNGITNVASTLALGTKGSTDTLANLASTINSGSYGITATLNSAQTELTFTQTGGDGFAAKVSGASVTDTMSTSLASSTSLGTLTVNSASDKLTGALGGVEGDGSTAYTLNLSGQTLSQLAATINTTDAAYGITAELNQAGTSLSFVATPGDAGTPTIGNQGYISDVTPAGQTSISLTNQPSASEGYYSLGISGNVMDASTTGGTGNVGISTDNNGSGGTATISYSDAAGQSLSSTDLSNMTDAQAALTDLNAAISDVAAQDGYIGAQINTLNSVSQVLSTQSENVTAAQNAVQATDYASATSNMSKYEILSQTGISALAQANSMQQEVTKLLQ